MNIFLTSYNQIEAASHLDDLRLNKMILETAQLLSSGYRHLFGEDKLLYKDTHINHPCTIWTRNSKEHYSWLVEYFDALAQEKFKRDGFINKNQRKFHKSWQVLFKLFDSKKINYNIKKPQEFFNFNCTDFKEEKDVRIAYRKQLINKWINDKKPPKWTGCKYPDFAIKLKNDVI